MSKKDRAAERAREDRRRKRFWKLALPLVEKYVRNRFGYSFEAFDAASVEGPVLVVINHASAYDPIFTGIAFRSKVLSFIASEHLMRMKTAGALLDRYLSIIPHSKGAAGSRTALVAMKKMKRGESVFLAPEGEQTWDGCPLPVMPYTGRMARTSGAALVTYMIEGAYLTAPRWAFNTRKGKVTGHPVNVYTAEQLAAMSDEEADEAIRRDLAFDIYEWQKSQPGGPIIFRCSKGGNADGLERAVFSCPECGRLDGLRSHGDQISCSCGFSLRLEDTGFFEQPSPFETVADWEESDRAALRSRLEGLIRDRADNSSAAGGAAKAAEDTAIFSDGGVTLVRIEEKHTEKQLAQGELGLALSGGEYRLNIDGHSFSLSGISGMTMVLAARIVFSDSSGYYELRASKGSRTNLRKYVIAREINEEITREN